jgi:hypothetical protein
MPVNMVLDSPHQSVLRGPRQAARTAVGGLLLLLGIVASVPAVILAMPLLAFITNGMKPTVESIDDRLEGQLALIGVVSIVIAIVGGVMGLSLLRGRRQLVLFLRRFGYDDATEAITFAAAYSIGRNWRLVTLDDHEVAPLGVPLTTRRLAELASIGSKLAAGLSPLLSVLAYVAGVAWAAMLAIIASDAIGKPDLGAALLVSAFKHLQLVMNVFQAGHLAHPLGLDLSSVFLVLTGIEIVVLVIATISIPVLLLVLPLMVPIAVYASTIKAVQTAEGFKRRTIHDPLQVDALAIEIARESRQIQSPRLVVLTVASTAWRQTVSRFAMVSSAIIIDISEPTENLLWEIQELKDRFGSRFVLIGDHSHVQAMAGVKVHKPGSLMDRLLSLLDGQTILAYTTDRPGRNRFSRALRNRLEALPPVKLDRGSRVRRAAAA